MSAMKQAYDREYVDGPRLSDAMSVSLQAVRTTQGVR